MNNHTPLQITMKMVSGLKPSKNNTRTHSKKQIDQLKNSINAFGFTVPVLVDEHDNVLAGHGRLEAAKLLDIKQVPTICVSYMNEAQKRAYAIADNRIAELAGWDKEALAIELEFLTSVDLDFDLSVIGFETEEIDFLISETSANLLEDDPVPMEDIPPLVKPGELYRLGPHRLLCGDATDEKSYQKLLDNETASMVFTDAPYNVKIEGHVGNSGNIKHKEFDMASGEMSPEQFTDFLTQSHQHMAKYCINGAIIFSCMDWRHIPEITTAAKRSSLELKNLCIWVKDNGGMGSFYRSRHELVFVFKNGEGKHINNIDLGKNGRYRTNVWEYAGVNSFRKDRMNDLSLHPTVKPTAMVMDAIYDCSKRNDIILDPFGGSGTTLIAAEKTGRQARLIELDPHYCDVIIYRWEKLTGYKAILCD